VKGKPRKASGWINLDLRDKDKASAVSVFFVPAQVKAMGGSFMQGTRVQFHLGFTQENGYEAFEVSAYELRDAIKVFQSSSV
jgi:hypothetical protein